ncbi:MAG: hypothetical protein COB54_03905 [Alphaproteobacteria bacterium]|nr:MAG: hypothetical protein COB54_03905 [Alphaproteobacteria bacterium]
MIRIINIGLPTPTPDGLSLMAIAGLSVVLEEVNWKKYPPGKMAKLLQKLLYAPRQENIFFSPPQ